MKTRSTLSFLFVGGTVLVGALLAAAPGNSHKGGTSILHFFVRKAMVNEGVLSDATGRVEAKQNQQGNANNQRLEISLRSLEADATYHLLARLDDDTNFTQVAQFTANGGGAAQLRFRRIGSSKGHGAGHGKSPLPDVLNPLKNVRELAIANSSTQTVLTADLTEPDKLHYLIKRSMDNDGVDADAAASLRIHATTRKAQFRLRATGLDADATYFLALNGEKSETHTADGRGRLNLTTWLVDPDDVLDVHQVALWNSVSNSVLSAELP